MSVMRILVLPLPLTNLSDSSPRTSNSTMSDTSEKTARELLTELQALFEKLNDARRRGDTATSRTLEPKRAQALQNSSEEEKEHVMLAIAKGLGIILLTPFVLVGGIVGGAVFAAGKGVHDLGSRLTTPKPRDR
ncbi:hypothetical protein RHS01_06094 [Rhizoctonia solani]|uniref:Uncharacterized protein n=1 Tax=Rhizoctonia solani TaxID=456999 RepID=A0A8H7IAC0_9AGAM|nr:hypothetical protein RHS01_06094 [Rhizoctonia solani]